MDLNNLNFGSEETKKCKNLSILKRLKDFDKETFKRECKIKLENDLKILQENWKLFAGLVFLALVFMFLVCWITFFATVRKPEQVMVPNVAGKELTDALLEMQARELYPKIQMRYTDSPDDAGKILNQNPDAGTIVKAGRRITLTVSRGMILDHVENYIGQNFEDVKINLQTMFTGSSRPLIVLEEPSYKADESPYGTILAQDPPEGTIISNPIDLKLIVSRGPAYENTKIPYIEGMDFYGLFSVLSTSKVVFDFNAHVEEAGETGGTVVSQAPSESEFVKNYSRTTAELALPKKNSGDNVYGLFRTQLTDYPYAVEMTLEYSLNNARQQIVKLKHVGGSVTIPYIAPKGSELILTVAGKAVARQMVE